MGDYEPRGSTEDYGRRENSSPNPNEDPPAAPPETEPAEDSGTDFGPDHGDAPPPQSPSEQTVEGADGFPIPSKDDRTMALFAHLGGMIVSFATGLGFVVPLVIWLVKKDDSAFIDDQGKEALNFQLTILLVMLGFLVLTVVTCGVAAAIGWPILILVAIGQLILGIIATIKSYDGERYRYPVCIRLIK